MRDRLPPPRHDPVTIGRLRQAFDRAGFDAESVAEAIGAEGPNLTPSPGQIPALLRSLQADSPLATLVRLFVAAVPVPVDEAAAALAPLSVESAQELNLLSRVDGHVEPALRVVPAGPVLVAFDLIPDPSSLPADVVMGVSSTSWALAHLTIRRPLESALDVGTGCGIQALLAARHAGRVTATDTNARALEFARFSATLNDLVNIEFLEGDTFDPVAGRRFDFVLANPPFVISPDADYQYRDGGRPRDELSRSVVEGAARLLPPGGFAQMLVGWVHEPGGDWFAPIREWVDGLGCDAWLFHFESRDSEEYAVDWNQPLLPDPERHAAAVSRWLDYFDAEGIEAIAYGAVVLRRRAVGTADERPWVRAKSVGGPPAAPAGDQVSALFATGDFLERTGRDALAGRRFGVDDSLRIEQVLRLRDGDVDVEQAMLHLERGLPMAAEVDEYAVHLLARLEQGRTIADVCQEAAAEFGVDPEVLTEASVELVAGLLELGFLHPG